MSTTPETSKSTESTARPAMGMFPFAFPFPGETWAKAMQDGFERSKAFWDEYAKLEAQGLAHARTVMGEQGKLGVEALDYVTNLGAAWRKLAFESSKRALDMVTGR